MSNVSKVIEFFAAHPVAAVILAGEVGFWVLLFGGLAVRYLVRWRRLSTMMLIGVPLIDVVVLAATYLHLRSGAEPDITHGLAALYLGFSVAFGHSLLRWADARFAHRFAGGPPPEHPPKYGAARVRREWREFGKLLVAWAISAAVIGVFVLAFPERAEPMWSWPLKVTPVVAVWFVVGPLWCTIAPPKDPSEPAAGSSADSTGHSSADPAEHSSADPAEHSSADSAGHSSADSAGARE